MIRFGWALSRHPALLLFLSPSLEREHIKSHLHSLSLPFDTPRALLMLRPSWEHQDIERTLQTEPDLTICPEKIIIIIFKKIIFFLQWTWWKRCRNFGKWNRLVAPIWRTERWWFTSRCLRHRRLTSATSPYLADRALEVFRYSILSPLLLVFFFLLGGRDRLPTRWWMRNQRLWKERRKPVVHRCYSSAIVLYRVTRPPASK